MKILVVGGTGLIGGRAATDLHDQGHEVTIAARRSPPAESPMSKLQFFQGSYIGSDFSLDSLAGYDALVFSAANDFRQIPSGESPAEFFQRANIDSIPAFARKARAAGVSRFVYIGTLYTHLRPELANTNLYVHSRVLADEALRALAAPDFHVVTLDIPFAIGGMPGVVAFMWLPIAEWALGRRPGVPLVAPGGGSNFMSVRSVSKAIRSAIEGKGENGRAYLIGGQNLSFRDLCHMFFRAAGRDNELPVTPDEHPLLPDAMLPAGRGGWLRFEPEADELFAYRTNDLPQAIEEILHLVR